MSNVIIFGANGRTGRLVVAKALEAGHNVTAAVRNTAAFDDFVATAQHRNRLTVVKADATNAPSVRAAAEGNDSAIAALSGGRHPNHLLEQSAKILGPALKVFGVSFFQCVSSGAVEKTSGGFIYGKIISPLFMSELYDDMRQMEKIVEISELDWSLVRPGYLVDKAATGTWRVQDVTTARKGWKISRDDLASFLVQQIDKREWIRKHPTVVW